MHDKLEMKTKYLKWLLYKTLYFTYGFIRDNITFTNLQLDDILKSVYKKRETITSIPKREKALLPMHKNVHFSFNN